MAELTTPAAARHTGWGGRMRTFRATNRLVAVRGRLCRSAEPRTACGGSWPSYSVLAAGFVRAADQMSNPNAQIHSTA